MIHKIKCPACKGEFDLDIEDGPTVAEGMSSLAITKCQKCGIPLINLGNGDNWELLKPSDIHKMPKDLQGHIAALLLGAEEVASLKQAFYEANKPVTPFDRARIFLPVGPCNSEGCIVMFGPKDWAVFANLSNMHNRPEMRDALHKIATMDNGQVAEDN
jgi:hypothetical protein